MPGTPPQPTSLKILRGNPGRRPLNMDEPKPNLANGAAPAFLPEEARAVWDRIAPELVATDRLAIEDQDLLAAGCWLLAKARKYAAWVDREETLGVSPFLGAAIKCFDRAVMILARFGVTPSERSKIHVGHDAHRDPVEAYRAKPSRRPPS
jgi:phage terminase small subunit